eukprot:Skav204139  [mRNA]  locus=scaffold4340:88754:89293:- [translate_table: standard]
MTGKGKKHLKLYQKMFEIGEEYFYIELIKETPCENKEQLGAIEGEYIRQYGTLNTRIEGRTKSQYILDTKEKKTKYDKKRREEKHEEIKEEKKAYYDQNKDEINERRKHKYQEDREQILEQRKIYRQNHLEEIRKRDNENRRKHKDTYNTRRRERVECPHCKTELSKGALSRHLKIKHS